MPLTLSQLERDECSMPTEHTIIALAEELKLDANILLAIAGEVSSELQAIIRNRPLLFAELLASLQYLSDDAILKLIREVHDVQG